MENYYLLYSINDDNEYCIFLDKCTLSCYLSILEKIHFTKKKLIVDQLFYTGNQKNRFVIFEIANGTIDLYSAKVAKLAKEVVRDIDKVIFNKFDELCKEYLSYSDYKAICNKIL